MDFVYASYMKDMDFIYASYMKDIRPSTCPVTNPAISHFCLSLQGYLAQKKQRPPRTIQ